LEGGRRRDLLSGRMECGGEKGNFRRIVSIREARSDTGKTGTPLPEGNKKGLRGGEGLGGLVNSRGTCWRGGIGIQP